MGILATIIVGALAGWLGGVLYKGSGLGLIGNIVIGILGSFVGYWLFGLVGANPGAEPNVLIQIIVGAIGAVVILFLINLVFRK
jgi:uncharacterized membrane protein YeaQ/YmgE (transglycosylase-associated protein family)